MPYRLVFNSIKLKIQLIVTILNFQFLKTQNKDIETEEKLIRMLS